MLTHVQAGPYTVTGVSVGGVYTSLSIPELDALLDVGISLKSFVGAKQVFISHGHADHIGALPALMGVRGLHRMGSPRVFLPTVIVDSVRAALDAFTQMQGFDLAADLVPVKAGDELCVKGDLHVRVFRTHHRVPSVGYQFFRRVQKLKPEYLGLPGSEIGRLRQAGRKDLFEEEERLELAYATDTLLRVIDTHPSLLSTKVLILECSFLDEKKSLKDSRAGCHVHLDELLERADDFQNERLVLMHFSQIYKPREVHEILARRCPPRLLERLAIFAPPSGGWPG